MVRVGGGVVVRSRRFSAWGESLVDAQPGWLPFGYAGGLEDVATGLVRSGARDYEPATGRWLAKDPIGFARGDANLYAYVGNDPVDAVDPNGTDVWLEGPTIGLGEPNGHYSISVGNPNGEYESYSFGVLQGMNRSIAIMPGIEGAAVYSDNAPGGYLLAGYYRSTSLAEDRALRTWLRGFLQERGAYLPATCRGWSLDRFQELVNQGMGVPGQPTSQRPNTGASDVVPPFPAASTVPGARRQ